MQRDARQLVLVRRQLVSAGRHHPAQLFAVAGLRVAGDAAERRLDAVHAELQPERALWEEVRHTTVQCPLRNDAGVAVAAAVIPNS